MKRKANLFGYKYKGITRNLHRRQRSSPKFQK